MKKLIIVMLALVLVSCSASLELLDEDGFRLYNLGGWLGEEQYIIQSHEFFMIDDTVYEETVHLAPVTIKNFQSKPINVKISPTYENEKWHTIAPHGELTIIAEEE